MIQTINDVSLGDKVSSCYVNNDSLFGTFDVGLELLDSRGYEVISLEETAILRMIGGVNFRDWSKDTYPSVSGRDCITKEAWVYVPEKGFFITKDSPIIQNPKEASEAQRYGSEREYLLTFEQIEKALTNAIKVSDFVVPTDKFGESEIANYCFGGSAEAYGWFLKEAGINLMPIDPPRIENLERPFARQVQFNQLYVPVINGMPGYSGLSSSKGDQFLRGIKIEQKNGFLEIMRQRFFPTEFERYTNLPEKEIESGKNPRPGQGDQNQTCQGIINSAVKSVTRVILTIDGKSDAQPEIAELSDAFNFSPYEEKRIQKTYDNLLGK